MSWGAFLKRLEHPLVDRWLPDRVLTGEPQELLRFRIVSAMLQGLTLLALTFAILDAANGLLELSAPTFVGVALAAGVLLRMRAGASLRELAFTSSAITYVVIVTNASLNGGIEAPALFLLPLVPMVPLFVGRPRMATAWVVLCVLTVGLGFVVESLLGVPLPEAMTADMLPLNRSLVIGATCAFVYSAFLLHTAFGSWMQERLLEAEGQRLDRILDAAGDAIVRLDADWVVASGNAAARALFDVPDMEGRPVTELLPEARILEHASGATVLDAMGVDGAIPVEATCTYLSDGWVLVIRDIRERVRAQQALERALDETKAASAAKSRFLASMSHELRTPLNAVIGYAEMVAEDIDAGTPPEDSRDLHHIVGSARHLLALIDQVLDLAKVEAGKMEVELREVPLTSFLEELDTVGRALARGRGNRWRVELPCDGPTVALDEVRARQIALNLLSNAAKFCEQGEIALEARYADERLHLRVSDTGIGMTPEQLASVWDEFAQAEVSTHRMYGGTGLGLPLARRLTTLLGGTIEASSEPGRGTSFTLELPAPPV